MTLRTLTLAALIFALPLAAQARADSPPVVPPIKFDTGPSVKVGSSALKIDTVIVQQPPGTTATIKCSRCKRANKHPHSRPFSGNGRLWNNLGWVVTGSHLLEVDLSAPGLVGRWMSLGLERLRKKPSGASCFRVGRRAFECLVTRGSGCLHGTSHIACPSGTPIQKPFVVVPPPPGVTPPQTKLVSGPPPLTNSATAKFTFASSSTSDFDCQLDGGDWLTCDGGSQTYNLPDGRHTFAVRARDGAVVDPKPATSAWTIDTTPPHTVITAGPPSSTSNPTATFTYTSSEAGSHFECNFHRLGWSACGVGFYSVTVDPGNWSVGIRAIDPAGNIDPNPPIWTWTRNPATGTTTFGDDSHVGVFVENGGLPGDFATASGDPGARNGTYTTFPNGCSTPGDAKSVTWTLGGVPTGVYDVAVYVPTRNAADAPDNATYTTSSNGVQQVKTISQSTGQGQFVPIASQIVLSTTASVTLSDNDGQSGTCTPKHFAADAIRLTFDSGTS